MKSIIFVLTLILCGCEGAYKNKNEDKNGNGFSVVLVDGCEYITSPFGLTHQGNCKYCLKRQVGKYLCQTLDSITFIGNNLCVWYNLDSSSKIIIEP